MEKLSTQKNWDSDATWSWVLLWLWEVFAGLLLLSTLKWPCRFCCCALSPLHSGCSWVASLPATEEKICAWNSLEKHSNVHFWKWGKFLSTELPVCLTQWFRVILAGTYNVFRGGSLLAFRKSLYIWAPKYDFMPKVLAGCQSFGLEFRQGKNVPKVCQNLS